MSRYLSQLTHLGNLAEDQHGNGKRTAYSCCGTVISLRFGGLTRIELHPEYQSIGRSSFSFCNFKEMKHPFRVKNCLYFDVE